MKCGFRMNNVNKKRDKCQHQSQEKNTHESQIDVYSSLHEGKQHLGVLSGKAWQN